MTLQVPGPTSGTPTIKPDTSQYDKPRKGSISAQKLTDPKNLPPAAKKTSVLAKIWSLACRLGNAALVGLAAVRDFFSRKNSRSKDVASPQFKANMDLNSKLQATSSKIDTIVPQTEKTIANLAHLRRPDISAAPERPIPTREGGNASPMQQKSMESAIYDLYKSDKLSRFRSYDFKVGDKVYIFDQDQFVEGKITKITYGQLAINVNGKIQERWGLGVIKLRSAQEETALSKPLQEEVQDLKARGARLTAESCKPGDIVIDTLRNLRAQIIDHNMGIARIAYSDGRIDERSIEHLYSDQVPKQAEARRPAAEVDSGPILAPSSTPASSSEETIARAKIDDKISPEMVEPLNQHEIQGLKAHERVIIRDESGNYVRGVIESIDDSNKKFPNLIVKHDDKVAVDVVTTCFKLKSSGPSVAQPSPETEKPDVATLKAPSPPAEPQSKPAAPPAAASPARVREEGQQHKPLPQAVNTPSPKPVATPSGPAASSAASPKVRDKPEKPAHEPKVVNTPVQAAVKPESRKEDDILGKKVSKDLVELKPIDFTSDVLESGELVAYLRLDGSYQYVEMASKTSPNEFNYKIKKDSNGEVFTVPRGKIFKLKSGNMPKKPAQAGAGNTPAASPSAGVSRAAPQAAKPAVAPETGKEVPSTDINRLQKVERDSIYVGKDVIIKVKDKYVHGVVTELDVIFLIAGRHPRKGVKVDVGEKEPKDRAWDDIFELSSAPKPSAAPSSAPKVATSQAPAKAANAPKAAPVAAKAAPKTSFNPGDYLDFKQAELWKKQNNATNQGVTIGDEVVVGPIPGLVKNTFIYGTVSAMYGNIFSINGDTKLYLKETVFTKGETAKPKFNLNQHVKYKIKGETGEGRIEQINGNEFIISTKKGRVITATMDQMSIPEE